MNCPVCRAKLIVNGQERLETLIEHVECREPSLKNSYICSNLNCPTHEFGVRWNDDGEFYCRKYDYDRYLKFIDNNNAPFGSFERKLNVEIYKHDEDFTLLEIFSWRLSVKYGYVSNEDGEILKRTWKIEAYHNNCLYISGISMFFYIINKKMHTWENETNPTFIGKEWWRYAATWFIYVFQRKRYMSWSKNKRGF